MKTSRLVQENEDSNRATARPPEPAKCPNCRAVFSAGKWSWDRAPAAAFEHQCPACQRIQDKFPAGYVTIKGKFLADHRDEIVALITSTEGVEKAADPLQRIIAIEDVSDGLQVTTTDSYLARGIGEALHETYQGDLKLRYSRDEYLLRATWKR